MRSQAALSINYAPSVVFSKNLQPLFSIFTSYRRDFPGFPETPDVNVNIPSLVNSLCALGIDHA